MTFYELLRDGFPAFLEEKYSGARQCAVLEHGLDAIGKRKSSDFPNLVVAGRGDSVYDSFPGNPAKGQSRQGFFDIVIAVRALSETNESYLLAMDTAEDYMDDAVLFLDTKATEIAEAGFANLRFFDDGGGRSADRNYSTYLSKVAGVQCVVGIVSFVVEYLWSDGDVYKNLNISPRR